ncbi:hypothetical protein ACTFIU_006789 [Dictyostelium citrinum]
MVMAGKVKKTYSQMIWQREKRFRGLFSGVKISDLIDQFQKDHEITPINLPYDILYDMILKINKQIYYMILVFSYIYFINNNHTKSESITLIGQMVVKLQVQSGIMNMIYNSCNNGFVESSTIIAESKKDCATKHSKFNNQPFFDIDSFYINCLILEDQKIQNRINKNYQTMNIQNEAWPDEEDQIIREQHAINGNKWAEIAQIW